MSFDLRRAEPTRRARYYWAMGVPAVAWVILAILVGTENSALQDLDDRVASWGFDLASGSAALESLAHRVAAAAGNKTHRARHQPGGPHRVVGRRRGGVGGRVQARGPDDGPP